MIIRENGTRYKQYIDWDKRVNQEYDYERYGVISKIMSPNIVKLTNPITKIILQYFEKSLIFVMKYTDVLKNFKNVHWKNR